MQTSEKLLLDSSEINQKLVRMSYEILEDNCEESEITFVGLNERGYHLAAALADKVGIIGGVEVSATKIVLDPAQSATALPELEDARSFKDKVVVLVDDVANSGKTLMYALKPLLDHLPRKIQIAVLVDRSHKRFPVHADFVGLALSTTLQEHITYSPAPEEAVYIA